MANKSKKNVKRMVEDLSEQVAEEAYGEIDINMYDVEDITAISGDILDKVKCGDIINKLDVSGRHSYRVSYKKAGTGICMTYCDASVVETVSYDFTGGIWVYNSTDVTPIPGGGSGGNEVYKEIDVSDINNATLADVFSKLNYDITSKEELKCYVEILYKVSTSSDIKRIKGLINLGYASYMGGYRVFFNEDISTEKTRFTYYELTNNDAQVVSNLSVENYFLTVSGSYDKSYTYVLSCTKTNTALIKGILYFDASNNNIQKLNYPNDTTKTYVLKCVNGSLTWVEEQA